VTGGIERQDDAVFEVGDNEEWTEGTLQGIFPAQRNTGPRVWRATGDARGLMKAIDTNS